MSTQHIGLEGIVSDVEFTQLQVYSDLPISVFDYAISSTEFIEQPQLNTVVVHLPTLFANLEISVFQSSTISEYETYSFGSETPSLVAFGAPQLNFVIYPESIASTANLVAEVSPPLLRYPQTIYFEDILNEYYSIAIETYSSTRLEEFFTATSSSITSSVSFDDNIVINTIIHLESIESTLDIGAPELTYTVYLDSISSNEVIGDILQLGMNIDDVPFPSIESTAIIPNPNIVFKVGPLSIAPTVNFGTSNFIDNIHRLLVYKDDNISKVGNNDAVVIAGGIRLNPASTVGVEATSGSANLPSNPVGFLSININGNDYKIPYYNS